jgi:glycosyltransferase involved in cell wall biosynthesis
MHKVLYVCHNHPRNRPGGAEIYAYELYLAVRDGGKFEPIFVSKVGPPMSLDAPSEETRFVLAGADPNEYSFYTEPAEFDLLLVTARDKHMYTQEWRAFLRAQAPDIVHFQHAAFLGYDMIRETRRTLPNAGIVFTLHEFASICHHNGQMVKTNTHELCHYASPRRCHQCFPDITMYRFFHRERFIKSAFELVDVFIAPSEHARHRFIEWGIPPEKIRHEDYGRLPVPALPDPPEAGRRNRLGFFGQVTEFKGVDVLLEAMKILQRQGVDARLLLYGANLEFMEPVFQARILALIEENADSVRPPEHYEQAELPGLLSAVDWVVVPSIWWETGPLVIHEALMHRRPVICSDIGSMLERVHDGVNGLHFRVGDPFSLADTIRRAMTTPGLWDRLRGGITDPHPMGEHVAVISAIYGELLDRGRRLEVA